MNLTRFPLFFEEKRDFFSKGRATSISDACAGVPSCRSFPVISAGMPGVRRNASCGQQAHRPLRRIRYWHPAGAHGGKHRSRLKSARISRSSGSNAGCLRSPTWGRFTRAAPHGAAGDRHTAGLDMAFTTSRFRGDQIWISARFTFGPAIRSTRKGRPVLVRRSATRTTRGRPAFRRSSFSPVDPALGFVERRGIRQYQPEFEWSPAPRQSSLDSKHRHRHGDEHPDRHAERPAEPGAGTHGVSDQFPRRRPLSIQSGSAVRTARRGFRDFRRRCSTRGWRLSVHAIPGGGRAHQSTSWCRARRNWSGAISSRDAGAILPYGSSCGRGAVSRSRWRRSAASSIWPRGVSQRTSTGPMPALSSVRGCPCQSTAVRHGEPELGWQIRFRWIRRPGDTCTSSTAQLERSRRCWRATSPDHAQQPACEQAGLHLAVLARFLLLGSVDAPWGNPRQLTRKECEDQKCYCWMDGICLLRVRTDPDHLA